MVRFTEFHFLLDGPPIAMMAVGMLTVGSGIILSWYKVDLNRKTKEEYWLKNISPIRPLSYSMLNEEGKKFHSLSIKMCFYGFMVVLFGLLWLHLIQLNKSYLLGLLGS